MSVLDSVRLSCQVARLRANIQVSDGAYLTWLTSIREETYTTALRRLSLPRLPLTFPSLLHEINLVSIIALLDHDKLREEYSTAAKTDEGSYDDVILRGVMACYITSSEDDWKSRSNLLGAAGMGLSDQKVSEMFNLPLSIMTERDHPSLPGIKIGERSEGRHAGLVKSMGKNLRDVSKSLAARGYSNMGEVVERAFAEAEETKADPHEVVGRTLLSVAPCLGESYEIQGFTVDFHAPLLRLFHNILTLLSQSTSPLSSHIPTDGLRSPAISNLAAGLSALRLDLFDFSATTTREGEELRDYKQDGTSSKLSPDAIHLLRACTVDACEQMGSRVQFEVDQGWKREITAVGISASLEEMDREFAVVS